MNLGSIIDVVEKLGLLESISETLMAKQDPRWWMYFFAFSFISFSILYFLEIFPNLENFLSSAGLGLIFPINGYFKSFQGAKEKNYNIN